LLEAANAIVAEASAIQPHLSGALP
jgi:hypothetical protein